MIISKLSTACLLEIYKKINVFLTKEAFCVYFTCYFEVFLWFEVTVNVTHNDKCTFTTPVNISPCFNLCFFFILEVLKVPLLEEAVVRRCSVKKVFLEISQNSEHRCLPVNFAKFLRTPFLIEHHRWLLLYMYHQILDPNKIYMAIY